MAVKPKKSWSKKRKIAVGAIVVAVAVSAGLASWGWWWLHRDDGLPAEEKIFRNLSKTLDPESPTIEKLAYFRRSWPSLSQMEDNERRKLLTELTLRLTRQTLTDFAALPPESKERRAALICEDAERMHQLFMSFPPAKRDAILNYVRTPDGKAEFNQLIGSIGSDLSANDRRMLGPAIGNWQKTLENR